MQYLLIKLEVSFNQGGYILRVARHLYRTSSSGHGQRFFAIARYGIVSVYAPLTYLRQMYFVERVPTELTFTQIETRLNRKYD